MRHVHKIRDESVEFIPAYLREGWKSLTPSHVTGATPHVYFIQDRDAIKIGAGQNPPGRLRTLQTGNPRELTMLGFYQGTDERALHVHFDAHWIRGEWFRDNPELRELIALKCPVAPAAMVA